MSGEVPIHRLLQRHAAGACEDHHLEVALREEIERLSAEEFALTADRDELVRFAGSQLAAFNQGIFAADACLTSALDFVGAYDQIRHADAALEEVRRFQSAIRSYREVEGKWAHLRDELALHHLEELPTLRIPRRLLDLSKTFLEDQRPRESAVTSRICQKVLGRLEGRGPSVKDLSIRLKKLRHCLAETRVSGEPRMTELERLVGVGRCELVSRLADDLEIELCGWRAQARRGRGRANSLVREMREVSRLADSVRQILGDWLPVETAAQPRKER
jgi:hypothetical protein